MSVRKLTYTVKTTGVEPATVRLGGVQGEHRATELVFSLESNLYYELQAAKELAQKDSKLIYRVDGYDGEGGVHRSDVGEFTENTVSYLLEEKITRFGGVVKVVLVIALKYLDETEMELYSFPVALQLKNLPDGRAVCGENHESMSVLAQVAKQNAETAVEAKEVAVEAKDKTVLAKAALEGDTEWVFDGGDAEGTVGIEFVIDNQMSDVSGNAIANKAVKAYVDGENEKIAERIEKSDERIEKSDERIEAAEEILDAQADYPIEVGTSGIWTYRKWQSGIAECWGGYTEENLNCAAKHFSGFYYSDGVTVDFPVNLFKTPPIVCFEGGSQNYINFIREFGSSETQACFLVISIQDSQTLMNVPVKITAKGCWK